MTEGQTGMFVLLVISVVTAFFAFALIRGFFLSFLVACAASAVAAAVLFQVAAYLHIGYLDPFCPIAVVMTPPSPSPSRQWWGSRSWCYERKPQ